MLLNHRIEAPLARSQEFLVAMRAVAHRGVPTPADECLLWGEERTWRGLVSMSANDPNRTLGGQRSRPSLTIERRLRSTLLEGQRQDLDFWAHTA